MLEITILWCPRPDLNRYSCWPLPPQDSVSTNSTTRAAKFYTDEGILFTYLFRREQVFANSVRATLTEAQQASPLIQPGQKQAHCLALSFRERSFYYHRE